MSIRATDGARLWCRVLGDGEHTVVVPGAVLDQDLERLADVGRRIVFVDSRNRGRSSAVAGPTRLGFHREVEDLDAVYEAFGIERASLIGWSYVGGVVTRYALTRPERVDRLVLVAPIAPSSDVALSPLPEPGPAELARLDQIRAGGDQQAVCAAWRRAYIGPQLVDPALVERLIEVACPHPNEWPDHVTRALAHVFVDLGLYDWRSELASFEVPTLVVEGDGPNEADAGVAWVTSAPNARLLRLTGALRHPWLEAPEAFFSAVGRFLGGDWPEGSRR
jgi:pimeloyl-ACP methyl ester carboxylesterase